MSGEKLIWTCTIKPPIGEGERKIKRDKKRKKRMREELWEFTVLKEAFNAFICVNHWYNKLTSLGKMDIVNILYYRKCYNFPPTF